MAGERTSSRRHLARHIITDHGAQFTARAFGVWCHRRGIQQRFGAIGKYGSLALIERFIKSMKNECTRLLPIVPLARAAFGREPIGRDSRRPLRRMRSCEDDQESRSN